MVPLSSDSEPDEVAQRRLCGHPIELFRNWDKRNQGRKRIAALSGRSWRRTFPMAGKL